MYCREYRKDDKLMCKVRKKEFRLSLGVENDNCKAFHTCDKGWQCYC